MNWPSMCKIVVTLKNGLLPVILFSCAGGRNCGLNTACLILLCENRKLVNNRELRKSEEEAAIGFL